MLAGRPAIQPWLQQAVVKVLLQHGQGVSLAAGQDSEASPATVVQPMALGALLSQEGVPED
eukprot:11674239-Alexandrium_andersonii.AAC.1